MANKDDIQQFVQRQIMGVKIKTPKTQEEIEQAGYTPEAAVLEARKKQDPLEPVPVVKKKAGRPKEYLNGYHQMSLYIPVGYRQKLEEIQHFRRIKKLNTVIVEALDEYIEKYYPQ